MAISPLTPRVSDHIQIRRAVIGKGFARDVIARQLGAILVAAKQKDGVLPISSGHQLCSSGQSRIRMEDPLAF